MESFEDELADRTSHITWDPVAHEASRRSAAMPDLGGTISRDRLGDLSPTLMKRALGRLIGEGTGQRPARHVLQNLAEDLSEGRNGRREIHEGWSVQLQSDAMHLTPPSTLLTPSGGGSGGGGAALAEPAQATQTQAQATVTPRSQVKTQPRAALELETQSRPALDPAVAPAPAQTPRTEPAATEPTTKPAPLSGAGLHLGLPGAVQLPDGRSIHASVTTEAVTSTVTTAEIDADGLADLQVRFSQPGDRFRGLGAPGHKPLRRFLSDIGIPRGERGNVPLVVSGSTGEIVWVAGVRIAESRKVQAGTKKRVKLSLEGVRER